jgi:hypothetical protein
LHDVAEPRHAACIDGAPKPETSVPTYFARPERENGMMLICISRAAEGSQLTLDL